MFKKSTLIAALIAASGMTASADSFSLTTDTPVGGEFKLCLDAGTTATLRWGDGTEETLVFAGEPLTTTVKDQKLSIATDTYLTAVYLNGNRLTSFTPSSLTRIEVLDLNDNALTSLTLSKLTTLSTLWCMRNSLTSLNLSKQPKLRKLYVSDNALTSLTLSSDNITDMWVDGNALEGTLDLSKDAALRSLCVENNNFGKIDLNSSAAAKKALGYFYAQGNALFYNSFPTVYDKAQKEYTMPCQLAPQRHYYYVDGLLTGQQYDLSDLIRYNAWGVAISPSVGIYDPTESAENPIMLVKGSTSAPEDYTTAATYKYTFNTEHRSAYVTVTSESYPDVELRTKRFAILSDLSGINDISNSLPATSPAYDLQGRKVRETNAGLYIKNGKKLIIK